MKTIKGIGVVLAIFVTLLATSVGLRSLGLVQKDFFGTWNADVEHNIYKHNQAHVEGTISHINRLRLDYETADSANQKSALARLIKQEASRVEETAIPYELKTFINSL